jgi:hypothetical protein
MCPEHSVSYLSITTKGSLVRGAPFAFCGVVGLVRAPQFDQSRERLETSGAAAKPAGTKQPIGCFDQSLRGRSRPSMACAALVHPAHRAPDVKRSPHQRGPFCILWVCQVWLGLYSSNRGSQSEPTECGVKRPSPQGELTQAVSRFCLGTPLSATDGHRQDRRGGMVCRTVRDGH